MHHTQSKLITSVTGTQDYYQDRTLNTNSTPRGAPSGMNTHSFANNQGIQISPTKSQQQLTKLKDLSFNQSLRGQQTNFSFNRPAVGDTPVAFRASGGGSNSLHHSSVAADSASNLTRKQSIFMIVIYSTLITSSVVTPILVEQTLLDYCDHPGASNLPIIFTSLLIIIFELCNSMTNQTGVGCGTRLFLISLTLVKVVDMHITFAFLIINTANSDEFLYLFVLILLANFLLFGDKLYSLMKFILYLMIDRCNTDRRGHLQNLSRKQTYSFTLNLDFLNLAENILGNHKGEEQKLKALQFYTAMWVIVRLLIVISIAIFIVDLKGLQCTYTVGKVVPGFVWVGLLTNSLSVIGTLIFYCMRYQSVQTLPQKSSSLSRQIQNNGTILTYDSDESSKTLLNKILKILPSDTTIRRIQLRLTGQVTHRLGQFAEVLKYNRKVKEIMLYNMVVSGEAMKALVYVVQMSQSIERLHFKYCQFEDPVHLLKLSEAIDKNKMFRDIIIHSGTPIPFVLTQDMVSLLKINPKLSLELKDQSYLPFSMPTSLIYPQEDVLAYLIKERYVNGFNFKFFSLRIYENIIYWVMNGKLKDFNLGTIQALFQSEQERTTFVHYLMEYLETKTANDKIEAIDLALHDRRHEYKECLSVDMDTLNRIIVKLAGNKCIKYCTIKAQGYQETKSVQYQYNSIQSHNESTFATSGMGTSSGGNGRRRVNQSDQSRRNSKTNTIIENNLQLTDQCVANLQKFLGGPNPIVYLNLSGVIISKENFVNLIKGIALKSQILSHLMIKSSNITDEHIEEISTKEQNFGSLMKITHLDISDNQLSCLGLEQLLCQLKNLGKLEKLVLNYNPVLMGKRSSKPLSKFLKQNTTLKQLHLNHCSTTTNMVSLLDSICRHNTTLESLHIKQNRLSDKVLTSIGQILIREGNPLYDINLSENVLTEKSIQNLLEVYQESCQNPPCTLKLDLSKNPLKVSGQKLIFCSQTLQAQLVSLNLNQTLGEHPAPMHIEILYTPIQQYFSSATNLRYLQMQSCLINHVSVLHLVTGLNENSRVVRLVSLDLSHNPITRKGARYLGLYLHNHDSIENITLNSCFLRNSGFTYILMALTDEFIMKSIKTLSIEDNQIDFLWALRLDYKFAEPFRVKHLNIARNDLNERGLRFLCEYLNENETGIEHLDLSYNNITRESLRSLREYLRMDKNIKKIILKGNGIPEENADILERRKRANELLKIEYV